MSQTENSGIHNAIRTFQYGLHVLTSGQGQNAHAATISWVTQISLKPRRVAIGVRKDSHIYPVVKEQGAFALNIVGTGQESLASAFFKFVPAGENDLAGQAFEAGPETGSPLLLETPAWLECRVVEEANAGGDHALFIADVLAGAVRNADLKPLALAETGWAYGG